MKLKSVDISKTAPTSSIVFQALRQAIIDGDIADGEPLRQDEIAGLFNTSRIPVREAISRLAEQGLVETRRYKGAFVAGLSIDKAEEIFDLRALLEPQIIRLAVPLMSTELLSKARTQCAAFSNSTNTAEWGELNRNFHATLYGASQLPFHIEIANNAMDRVDRYLRAQLVLSDGMARANKEHLEILAACEKGEADLAAALTKAHILGAKQSLVAHLQAKITD